MATSKATGWITARLSANLAPQQVLPIKITDHKSIVRAKGVTGTALEVPVGRYLVSADSADGQQWATDTVEVSEGHRLEVQLGDEQVELPDLPDIGLVEATGDAPARPYLPLTHEAAATDCGEMTDAGSIKVLSGQWLQHLTHRQSLQDPAVGLGFPVVSTSSASRFSLEAKGTDDVLLEIPDGEQASYFAVPFDAGQPTTIDIGSDRAGRPIAQLSFAEPQIATLVQYVGAGQFESARSISKSIVDQAEETLRRRERSPLLAALACYVLLRANEVDELDRATEKLFSSARDTLADARVIHIETLARLGRHHEAVSVLAMPGLRMPCVRAGIGYLEQRLQLYSRISEQDRNESDGPSVSPAQHNHFSQLLRAINRVSWSIDITQPFCTYRSLSPLATSRSTPLSQATSNQTDISYRRKPVSVSLRDQDIEVVRQTLAQLRKDLEAREQSSPENRTEDSDAAMEIEQRRRYIDELVADLAALERDPPAPDAFQSTTADAASPNGLAIVIGHSSEGTDKGASGLSPPFPSKEADGRAEYYWNQDLARRIEQMAAARAIRVGVFRRKQNGGPGIREAYRLAEQWGPQATVELHFNSASSSARGSETLYGRSSSIAWARALQNQMVALYNRTGLLNRGLKDANVDGRGVLSLTNSVQPSALIEPFFGSNTEDAELGIARKDGLAAAVINAFADFAGLPVPNSDQDASADAPAATALWDELRDAYRALAIQFPHLKGISFAQWALESGRGTSVLATCHLNFAGMKWRPIMSDIASKVWYQAHDGGEFYCKFASLSDFIRGYWLRLDRHPSYQGWRNATATPEGFFNFVADTWAPPSENPNYKPKVLDIYSEYRNTFDNVQADDASVGTAPEIPSDEDFWVDRTPDAVTQRSSDETADDAVARADAESSVAWAADPVSCDYAHILDANLPVGMQFKLTASDLAFLCDLNQFPVAESSGTPVLFGLRGAAIVSGGSASDGSWRDEVVLKNIRPNHHEVRCVMGVWDRQLNRIAVYPASTVPHAESVVSWFNTQKSGNMLATGMYRYICGVHNGKPGCFLLRSSVSSRRKVIVRRTADNLTYEATDIFQNMAPGDNIHPSFSHDLGWFSSFGCQVVVGSATLSGEHSGPWSRFRRSAGLVDSAGVPGRPFLYVLLTGQEALMAALGRQRGITLASAEGQALRRLRFGSKGSRVAKLQARLGIAPADADFGPDTGERLHSHQNSIQGSCDGIYSPRLDAKLGWGLFGAEA